MFALCTVQPKLVIQKASDYCTCRTVNCQIISSQLYFIEVPVISSFYSKPSVFLISAPVMKDEGSALYLIKNYSSSFYITI